MLATFCALVLLGGGVYVAFRHLRRWLTSAAAVAVARDLADVLLPERPLSRRTIERRIYRSMRANVLVSVVGRTRVPATYLVSVSEPDWEVLAPSIETLRTDLAAAIADEGARQGWTVPHAVEVVIDVDDRRRNGWPLVRAGAATGTETPAPVAAPVAPLEAPASPAGGSPRWDAPETDEAGWPYWPTVPRAEVRPPAAEPPVPAPPAPGGPATVAIVPSCLVSLDPDRCASITSGPTGAEIEIGRGHQAGLAEELLVSSTHCRLVAKGSGWELVDAGSRNGTYVDGQAIQSHELVPGETVQLGRGGPRFVFTLVAHTVVSPDGLAAQD